MTPREHALLVVQRLRQAGFQALWAGGCVRDELLGLTPHDFDVATDARPDEVQRLFRRTLAIGMSFGVVEVLGPRSEQGLARTQVATFRADGSYSDGRHPDQVTFSTAREDALRRDFTINGMFFDPIEEKLLDYVNGQVDLQHKLLRAIGAPAVRIEEDKLRMLRAARFAARYEFHIEAATADAIRANAQQIHVVSAERIAEELRKLLMFRTRALGVQLLFELSLVYELLPEVGHLLLEERAYLLRALAYLGETCSFPLAWACLLHHLPSSEVGRLSVALKLSNAEQAQAVWLVEQHQAWRQPDSLRLSQLKMLLAQPGIHELLSLKQATLSAAGRPVEEVRVLEEKLRAWPTEVLNPPPLLTGNDLIQQGLKPGPLFKKLLDTVREAQLELTIRSQAEALAMVQTLLTKEANPGSP